MLTDDIEVIGTALMKGKVDELPEYYKERYEIICHADDLIRQYGVSNDTKRMLCERYQIKAHAAYRFMGLAQQLFGTSVASEKQYWKSVSLGRMQRLLHLAYEDMMEVNDSGVQTGKLKKTVDMRDIEKYFKMEAQFHEILGTNKEDPKFPGGEVPDVIIPTFDPEQLGIPKSTISASTILRMYKERAEEATIVSEEGDEPEA
ncbi:hypothetical protein UFOVP350_14 [uncultured Caudovirales phage]|uniref:Uncharacterized protein n=1 Tax=uncultured Caudovirales phage TaxID=2100421 RepID=A0A6J5LW50_9CAUD|nr:hypothetical protein UFOVP350_14 [uncultured Caudovirales phage]